MRIGTAGWAIPAQAGALFGVEGSSLHRYSGKLNTTEINSSFYRPHRRSTYARWADSVPADFRFSVKAPKEITHRLRLADATALQPFVDDVSALGARLGCLLFQLPPSLMFDSVTARTFMTALRQAYQGPAVFEPRHSTWFTAEADDLFLTYAISRAAADPRHAASGNRPGGWLGTSYYRLHGSPQVYVSSYSDAYIASLAAQLRHEADRGRSLWCIFDNTARGEAILNALSLRRQLPISRPKAPRETAFPKTGETPTTE